LDRNYALKKLFLNLIHFVGFIAVTTNPRTITRAVGTRVTLTCSASGVDDVMYQWMRKGKRVIPSQARGVNTNRLVINSIQPDDSGEYRCTASSGGVSVNSEYGTVSVLGELIIESSVRHCYVFVVALPVITTHPNNNGPITVADGTDVMLNCVATGKGKLNYQWRRLSGSLPNSAKLSDNNKALTIRRISTDDNGEYYCEVDNGGTSVSSNRVQVTARSELLYYNMMC